MKDMEKAKHLHKLITVLKNEEGLSDYGVTLLEGFAVGLELKTTSPWIKVSERLPEIDGEYLTCCGGDEIGFSSFKNLKYVWKWSDADGDCTDYVTHWMPKPTAPKD